MCGVCNVQRIMMEKASVFVFHVNFFFVLFQFSRTIRVCFKISTMMTATTLKTAILKRNQQQYTLRLATHINEIFTFMSISFIRKIQPTIFRYFTFVPNVNFCVLFLAVRFMAAEKSFFFLFLSFYFVELVFSFSVVSFALFLF